MLIKEIQKLLKAVVVCAILCILIAAGVAGLLRTPLLADYKVYLYRLLIFEMLSCIALLIVAVVVAVKLKREAIWGFTFSAQVMCIGLSTLFMALFFSLGPMPIERSYTIYSLADMSDHPDVTYTAEDIKTQFIEGYIEGANESQKRIDEQVTIGNLEQTSEGYRITDKGRNLVALYRFIEAIFPVPDESSIYPSEINSGSDKP